MFCNGCGKEVNANGKFCPNCGATIIQAPQQSYAQPTQTGYQQPAGVQGNPTGSVNFLSEMRAFCSAITRWRNMGITLAVINGLLVAIIILVSSNMLNSVYRSFGVSMGGYGAGSVIGIIISFSIGIGFMIWLAGFILSPLEGLEYTYKYFSELTYEKKMRYGLTFSGRMKFIYVWMIISIISFSLTALNAVISLFSTLGAMRYLGGLGGWVVVTFLAVLIQICIAIPICAKVISTYKAIRASFGIVTPTDMYMFNQNSNAASNRQSQPIYSAAASGAPAAAAVAQKVKVCASCGKQSDGSPFCTACGSDRFEEVVAQ